MLLALEHLHQHKVVYKDLKSENVVICRSGIAKLVDFGLSASPGNPTKEVTP